MHLYRPGKQALAKISCGFLEVQAHGMAEQIKVTGDRNTRCTPPLQALDAKVVKLPAIMSAVGTNCGTGLPEARSNVVW